MTHRALRTWTSTLLLAAASAGVASSAQIYRSRAEVVVIDVSVMDGRRPVLQLQRDDFELRDSGVVQQILDFDSQTLPLDVTVTVDISGSMTPEKRATVERAIGQVSRALRPDDRGAVVTFAARISERSPLQAPPILVDLSGVGPGTSVRDALLLSLVTDRRDDRRQLNLFMTDGDDTSSYFDTRTVVETARHAGGQTSVILVRDNGRLRGPTREMIDQVAATTGGEVLELDGGDDLSNAFLRTVEAFRTSYVLRYTPNGVSATGWNEVVVRVKKRNYTVRARNGYWAG